MKCLYDYSTFVGYIRFTLKLSLTDSLFTDICGNVSGIFSGLLAYAFDTVSGAGGLSGWQW
jgi:hypothetical protein